MQELHVGVCAPVRETVPYIELRTWLYYDVRRIHANPQSPVRVYVPGAVIGIHSVDDLKCLVDETSIAVVVGSVYMSGHPCFVGA